MDRIALIDKVLSNEAAPHEQAILKRWIAESDANRQEYENIKLLREHAQSSPDPHRDDDEGFERVRQRMRKGIGRKRRLRLAISALLLFIALLLLVFILWKVRPAVADQMSANETRVRGMTDDSETLPSRDGPCATRPFVCITVRYTFAALPNGGYIHMSS